MAETGVEVGAPDDDRGSLSITEVVLVEGRRHRIYLGEMKGTVAVKVPLSGDARELANEARICSLLPPHNHIVRFFAHHTAPPMEALAMEPMMGGTLAAHLFEGQNQLASEKRFDWQTKMLQDVTNGLAFVHAHGIIHNNLSTRTVLLTADRRDAKIADFSRACLATTNADPPVTSTATEGAIVDIMGDALYTSPEGLAQPGRGTCSMAGDVFALGLLAWEVLTRSPLREGMRPPRVSNTTEGETASATAPLNPPRQQQPMRASRKRKLPNRHDPPIRFDDTHDWMPPLPTELASSPLVSTLLRACLPSERSARWPAAHLATLAARLHTAASEASRAAAATGAWVAELPVELALMIMARLSGARDLLAMRATCLSWKLLIDARTEDINHIYRGFMSRRFGGQSSRPAQEYYKETFLQYKHLRDQPAKLLPWIIRHGHGVLLASLLRDNYCTIGDTPYPREWRPVTRGGWQATARLDEAVTRRGHPGLMRALLEEGGAEYIVTGHILSRAALARNVGAFQLMLEHAERIPPDTNRLLRNAASMGASAIIEFLLQRGTDPNDTAVPEPGALTQACYAGDVRSAELLLAAGAIVSPSRYRPPLYGAVAVRSLPIVNLLLAAGAPVCPPARQRNGLGGPLKVDDIIHLAAQDPARLAILSRLLDADGERAVSVRSGRGALAMETALRNDNMPAARMLLERGGGGRNATLIIFDRFQEERWYGRDGSQTEAFLFLLDHTTPEALAEYTPTIDRRYAPPRRRGLMATMMDGMGYLPAQLAALRHPVMRGQVNALSGTPIAATPLHYAIGGMYHRDDLVNALLDVGATIQRDSNGRTPLMWLCEDDLTLTTMQRLIAAGDGGPDAVDKDGLSIYMQPQWRGKIHGGNDTPAGVISRLIAAGVDGTALDRDGNSAMHHLIGCGLGQQALELMDAHGRERLRADTAVNHAGRTLLHAVASSSLTMRYSEASATALIEALIERGCDLGARDNDGLTPRALAADRVRLGRLRPELKRAFEAVENGTVP